ncbi:MAG: hypothetical protein ACREQV_14445 [Candidatus Binatia bacterium]
MEEDVREQNQSIGYDSAEKIDEGSYKLGRFEVIVGAGLMLSAEDKETGTPVTFTLSAGESLQLADLIAEHREDISRYLFGEQQTLSGDPVHIDTGDGPEPIPINHSAQDRTPSASHPEI